MSTKWLIECDARGGSNWAYKFVDSCGIATITVENVHQLTIAFTIL